jgi:hypothetical protein
MSVYEGIKSKIYSTIHRNRKPIDQIADEMGISVESLYRYGLPSPSGSDIPLKRLIPLLKITNDYSILKHIASICGFVLVKIPRYRASKGDSNEVVSSYQKASAEATNDLIKFFQHPTFKNHEAVKNSLDKVMEESVGASKYIDKEYSGQIEIF